MKAVKALALLLICLPAFAQETGSVVATLTWEPPTERENGDALPEDQIARFEIVAERSGGAEQRITKTRTSDGALPTSHRHLVNYEFGPDPVEVVYRIRTVDVYGLESQWSEPVTYRAVVAPSRSAPAAPGNFSIGVECQDCTLLERE